MLVPFPFVDAPRWRKRPTVVVSAPWAGEGFALQWAVMVTSAANAGWVDDISLVERHAECGLDVPSVIRPAKIATINVEAAERVGTLPADLFRAVICSVASRLALT